MKHLARLKESERPTVLLVSHDQNEVFALADWILVLKEGKNIGSGDPETVATKPTSLEMARLVGENNIIRACYDGGYSLVFGDDCIPFTPRKEQFHQDLQTTHLPSAWEMWAVLPADRVSLNPIYPEGLTLKVSRRDRRVLRPNSVFMQYTNGSDTIKIICRNDASDSNTQDSA